MPRPSAWPQWSAELSGTTSCNPRRIKKEVFLSYESTPTPSTPPTPLVRALTPPGPSPPASRGWWCSANLHGSVELSGPGVVPMGGLDPDAASKPRLPLHTFGNGPVVAPIRHRMRTSPHLNSAVAPFASYRMPTTVGCRQVLLVPVDSAALHPVLQLCTPPSLRHRRSQQHWGRESLYTPRLAAGNGLWRPRAGVLALRVLHSS
jgi:hypothetical protein